ASTSSEMYADLYKLCQSVFEIASSKDVLFGNIGVLLILDDLDQKSRSKSLKIHSGNFATLHSTAKSLLDEAMSRGKKGKVRRLGVRLSDLQSGAGQHTMSQFMGG
ncbi:MAG: DNA polymerase IV, partial [Nitrososphaera sp.]|nr:DNA polymerase IV [Nitrososphaera sp.]